MHSNVNFPAPLAVLGFLAGIGGLLLGLASLFLMLIVGKPAYARWIAVVIAASGFVYFGLLFTLSIGSREETLAPKAEKYFCEIDCHLAYSVQDVDEEIRNNQRELKIVVRTRFDETTISPRRPKDAPLAPSPRRVVLIDRQGRTYLPVAIAGTPLSTSLIPGQSYETELDFLLSPDASEPRLLITTPGWEQHLVIGDENSLAHKKTFLGLTFSRSELQNEVVTPEFSSAFLHD